MRLWTSQKRPGEETTEAAGGCVDLPKRAEYNENRVLKYTNWERIINMKKQGKFKKIFSRLAPALTAALFVLLLFLTMSLIWCGKNFGNIGMSEILFTLNMPLEGSGSDLLNGFIFTVALPCLVLLAIVWLIQWLLSRRAKKAQSDEKKKPCRKIKGWLTGAACVWAAALVLVANARFEFFAFVKAQLNQSTFIEEQYADPREVKITFPEKQRNLIWIMLESGESSNFDKEHGGLFDVNYTPELLKLAEENVSFSQSELYEGAAVAPACGWTMAGMVAQFSGVPLKLYKYEGGNGTDNSMGKYKSFLPGVITLGELLEEQGYVNYYMLGSDATFSGQDKFMRQHGNYRIYDYYKMRDEGVFPQDYYVNWGIEDEKLFDYMKQKLTELGERPEPFHMYGITIDTHAPNGYVCRLCKNEYPEQYGNVWACSSRQVYDFVEWCKQQPFYEDTTIIITGDHCSMDPEFYKGFPYDKHHGETLRKVYNVIINPAKEPVQMKNRKFTTMDLFPTALSALGAEIEGGRLGLGTDLFSNEQTLAEEFGYETLFDELDRKSSFYNEKLLYQ